jgi:MFS family permease
VFYGIGRCLFSGNNDALMLESLKEQGLENDFAHYQGRAGGMFQLALGLSALIGGFVSVYGLRLVFALGVLPQLATVIVALYVTEPRIHIVRPKAGWRQLCEAVTYVRHHKSLRLLVAGQALSYGFGEATFWFMGTYVNTLWPSWALGIYRGINHAFGFAGFWFAGKILARLSPARMLFVADVAGFLSSFVAVVLGNGLSPLLMATGAVFFGPYMVARDQLLQSRFTPHQRATLGSIASFAGSILYAFAAVVIGVVSDRFGLAAGVSFGLLASLSALPFFIAFMRTSDEAL